MIDWRRILLGLTVLMLLIPVVAVGSPEDVPGFLRFWIEDTEARLEALEERVANLEAAAPSSTVTTNPSSEEPPNATSTTAATTSTSHDDLTTSTSSDVSSTTTTHHHTTTMASDSTTTTGHSTTTHTTTHSSGETITGDACPCMVTETTTLVGTINLKGDIMVDGGTLIARPGVVVNGNGHQIMFMNGGNADFQGTEVFTWSSNGSKMDLERDILFDDLRRIMFHQGAGRSTLRYFTIANSGNADVIGDYPLHFHLNGDSTRGTLVEGVVVINGRHHAFVPHGSHGITFKDTIAYKTTDDAYWWDPVGTNDPPCGGGTICKGIDNSNDILFEHALAHTVHDSDSNRYAGFVLGAGTGNVIRNSAAVNITKGGASCSGFHWPEFPGGKGGGQPRVWVFQNNYSRSDHCSGIFVWQNSGDLHLIEDFVGGTIDHGAYSNGYHYRNPNVDRMTIHAAGTKVTGGHIKQLLAPRHRSETVPTFELNNTTVDSFIIDNASNDGEVPGHYVLNGTGLTCLEIDYASVVPGTRVTIDGKDC